ncbi:nucleotide pyrophosphohydrolase [Thermococcus kodakarensis KOD1]|uniref:Nucleotide pyrophosphohydrolase n=1 Tax=Thermococcus kodakarensis (strain ATCC BAA-918 / JCM 12380 / KOD1) TaxID=69014 RepID=Q5JGL8_THEKO|nr:MazG nucleotide pyrophosphohydrolase domain-containing protein [Thermococcus kodakarensis]WCN27261.1 MazG nucleotide pyrophosphohydrolase domain-containing protein [Thermococcus kodakarensis]WCN29547.1 MazG nucleotide pyrophosphohydrolase domain-containing protein [Thermococcus kodakarensis]BAD85449.1 nucleotide pyrophosphohydrolase [Thermococcus kodakarensis KOD1]
MNELQRKVDELIQRQGGYWPPFQMLAALVEEVGELADAMLAFEGIKGHGGKEKLEEELGDVLYALLCIANHYGIDAFQALDSTVLKYRKRDLRS